MSDDPIADFLAREREDLGDDADMFQNPSDPAVTSPPAGVIGSGNHSLVSPTFDALSNDISGLNMSGTLSPSPDNNRVQADRGLSTTVNPECKL